MGALGHGPQPVALDESLTHAELGCSSVRDLCCAMHCLAEYWGLMGCQRARDSEAVERYHRGGRSGKEIMARYVTSDTGNNFELFEPDIRNVEMVDRAHKHDKILF